MNRWLAFGVIVLLVGAVLAGEAPPSTQATARAFLLKASEHLSRVEAKARGELGAELVVAWHLCGEPDEAERVAQGLTQEQRDEAYMRLSLTLAYRHDVDGAMKVAKSINSPKARLVVYGQVAMSHTMRGNDAAANDTLRLIDDAMILEAIQRRIAALQAARPGADPMGIVSRLDLSPEQRDEMAGLVAAKLAEGGDEAGMAMASTITDASGRAEAYARMAKEYHSAGRKDLEKRAIEGAVSSVEKVQDALRRADVLTTIANAEVACGQTAEALALVDKADRLVAQIPDAGNDFTKIAVESVTFAGAGTRAMAYLRLDKLDEAKRAAEGSDEAIAILATELVRMGRCGDLAAWVESLKREDQRVRAWVWAAEQLCERK